MGQPDIDRFRRRCGQFRWLAVFMVVSVGAILGLALAIIPRGFKLELLISNLPAVCYLFGVWSIGQALGEVSKGRPLQAALPGAMRKVGISLAIGGVISVFVVTNLMRLAGQAKGGYLHFDVAGMTLGMIGGALFLLGRVMDQALAAQAELDEMI
ncbi:DUF2975 domain-containing protein [Caulobacter sp. X]|uniref:DUF2975 domain-containing protein n=1 Tax=Caulobacter sp. X TaxID=2048901 RepID=UPI000C162301|nr:DUF2975 domain-containing protein [Caulobacter sp. X]PIB95804.1 DUF2975 domain-containing protein [Caulobacter sp. X]